jgi:hypothetical protein
MASKRSLAGFVLIGLAWIGVGGADLARAEAEGSAAAESSWNFVFTPYFWALSLDGDIDARRVDADFSADFDDILDNTNIAVMAVLEARRGAWGILVDSFYAELEDDDSRVGPIRVESTIQQTIIDAKLGYRMWGRSRGGSGYDGSSRLALDVLAGARYVRNRNEIEARLTQFGRDVDETVDWVDGVVGARLRVDLTETTWLSLNGDAGGFGVGSSSDFTWSAFAAFTWQPWEHWSLGLGDKVVDIDRDKVDIQQSGPALGLSYRF